MPVHYPRGVSHLRPEPVVGCPRGLLPAIGRHRRRPTRVLGDTGKRLPGPSVQLREQRGRVQLRLDKIGREGEEVELRRLLPPHKIALVECGTGRYSMAEPLCPLAQSSKEDRLWRPRRNYSSSSGSA